MAKKKENVISDCGCTLFNGTLKLTLRGKEYKVRCEFHGLSLKRASQNHEIVLLIRQHLHYNEIDSGYLVRTKEYDERKVFGLKARKSDRTWGIFNYNDVIAWGYADGGLNSNHFDSCRLRPEDYPQFANNDTSGFSHDDDDLLETEEEERCCVKFAYDRKTDSVTYDATVSADEEMTEGATPLMRAAAKVFWDFRKEHPEVSEMHFYKDDMVSVIE